MAMPTNPYQAAHASPSGAGDGRPTALQIISDEGLFNSLAGKTMLVTGTSSGIGVSTVAALHATGADIYMTARDMEKGRAVHQKILKESQGKGKLVLMGLELGDLENVRLFVEDFQERTNGKLNVLVNNAGCRNTPESTTKDGFETQFGTNHLGHFLLTYLLLPSLLRSSTPTFSSRVVNITSGSHRTTPMQFSNLNLLHGEYTPRKAYAQSKTANILHSNQIERLFGKKGVHGLAVSPGAILTGAQRWDGDEATVRKRLDTDDVLRRILKSTDQGAATSVWGAVGKVWEGTGGVYLEDCREGMEREESSLETGGYKKFAFDEESEKKLWEISCQMQEQRTRSHSMPSSKFGP
ncbi:hypothetical protein B7494_g4245 [Chlorociboria aeruginascens]|nr:hypothetical protein B7494_g4245 [Chlorociboria aeruginascens]